MVIVKKFVNYYYYYYSSSSISACSPRAGTNNVHVCAPCWGNKSAVITIFGIPHNFTNWLALLLQVDSLERPAFT
jgi:hypothetical protein